MDGILGKNGLENVNDYMKSWTKQHAMPLITINLLNKTHILVRQSAFRLQSIENNAEKYNFNIFSFLNQ